MLTGDGYGCRRIRTRAGWFSRSGRTTSVGPRCAWPRKTFPSWSRCSAPHWSSRTPRSRTPVSAPSAHIARFRHSSRTSVVRRDGHVSPSDRGVALAPARGLPLRGCEPPLNPPGGTFDMSRWPPIRRGRAERGRERRCAGRQPCPARLGSGRRRAHEPSERLPRPRRQWWPVSRSCDRTCGRSARGPQR